jgi:CRP-like cAMP-binding protein
VRDSKALPTGNHLFGRLSPDAQHRLRPYVRTVHLPKGRLLCETDAPTSFAWFPLNGMLSCIATTEEAQAVEIAMVGADGFVGLAIVLPVTTAPYEVRVQVAADAYRIPAEAFLREFRRGEDLHHEVLHVVHRLLQQLVQSVMCHSFHPLSKRLCRWLLASRDCLQSDAIELTQELVAQLLGVSRSTVSSALTDLEDRQMIRQRHGRIRIVDARAIESACCGCYAALKAGL